ncbi:MAG: hypothetical protein EOO07_19820 [Chitinophagaceae bacterium]|nr:MAG: hypothetical protein EOO07_19820 [Chitinophagaceae bacterium]
MHRADRNESISQIVFEGNALFKSITYDTGGETWTFNFTNDISISASTLWRLLYNKRIKLVSTDHLQKFGLPKPLDIIEEVSTMLSAQTLTKINISNLTADLHLEFSGNMEIEIFISSGGYESYNMYIGYKQFIGMGMGEIAVFERTKTE